MNHHLTDEQLAELLSSPDASPNASAAAQHLTECAACREELGILAHAVTSFRVASTHAAEQYTADAPRTDQVSLLKHASESRGSSAGFFARPQFAWAAGLAAVIALAAGSANVLHRDANVAANEPTVTQPAVIEAANTVSDDVLLQSIEQDLSTSVAPSLEPLSTSASTATTTSVSSSSKPVQAAANAD